MGAIKMIKLSEDRVIQVLTDYLAECDADDLARLVGDTFGGECFCKPKKVKRAHYSEYVNIYEFEPIEGQYMGAFEEQK
jgi:hypothetical protein